MRTITTRELLHRTKQVRAALEMGEPMAWTSHGRIVAYLQPSQQKASFRGTRDWLGRARVAGAVNEGPATVASLLYEDRS